MGILLAFLYLSTELLAIVSLRLIGRIYGDSFSSETPVLSQRQIEEVRALLDPSATGSSLRMVRLDPDLGWTLRPNHAGGMSTNADGIVALREYGIPPPEGIVRVAAFGDSFTMCVTDTRSTWEQILEDTTPNLEVLNFGVRGYGPDQSFLRYRREGRRFRPAVVLMCYMTENIRRVVNVFRPYIGPENAPFVKPRFLLVDGELSLLPTPLRIPEEYEALLSLNSDPFLRDRLGRYDNFYRKSRYLAPPFLARHSPLARMFFDAYRRITCRIEDSRKTDFFDENGTYKTDSEAYALVTGILSAWAREISDDGAIPIAVIFPQASDIASRRSGAHLRQHQPLLDFLAASRIRHLDLLPAFDRHDPAQLFSSHAPGHYSAYGNRIVAERLREYLRDEIESLFHLTWNQ